MTKKELQQLKSDYQYCYGELVRISEGTNEEAIKRERRFMGGYHRAVCTVLDVGHRQGYGIEIAEEWEEEVYTEWEKAKKEDRTPKKYW